MAFPILVLGGTGTFGSRICHLLARDARFSLFVAGRSQKATEALCQKIRDAGTAAAVEAVTGTLPGDMWALLEKTGAQLVIHAAGPFQGQDYAVAEACIARGVHYIDLADGSDFVAGFDGLDKAARRAKIVAVTGASSVPGISSAAVDHLRAFFEKVKEIEIGIAPGNRTPRGRAAVAAVLGYVGRPIEIWRRGRWKTKYGWQDQKRQTLRTMKAALRPRRFGLCDVPDLALFPKHYQGVRSVTFRGALELPRLHYGLWFLSWLVRWRVLGNLARAAGFFRFMANRFKDKGSDRGGMYVELRGLDAEGQMHRRRWTLIAESGDGPWIPAIPSVLLAKKLADGKLKNVGAMPCLGLFTLAEFEAEIAGLDVSTAVEDRFE